jgi:Fe2+ or Zn2+ uptake regulation protein
MTLDAYMDRLRNHGFKITPKRRAVIELFMTREEYLSPAQVWQGMKNSFRHLGLPTIYRILEEMKEAGILIRVEKDNRQLYYTLCKNPQSDHHHFICRRCRKVEEVAYCNFRDISEFIKKNLKARAETHTIQIEGLCSECK